MSADEKERFRVMITLADQQISDLLDRMAAQEQRSRANMIERLVIQESERRGWVADEGR